MKLYKKLGYVKQEEYDNLQQDYNKLQQEYNIIQKYKDRLQQNYNNILEKQSNNLENTYSKITELLSEYELIRNNFGDEFGIISDVACYVVTKEQVPTFQEFMNQFISELFVNDKIKFYEDVKPILLKYIKDEKKLKQLDLCIKPIMHFQLGLKRKKKVD